MNDNFCKQIFNDEISCVFATDDNYAPFLSVAIQSIIENSNTNNNYGIYILEENLSIQNKKKLKSQEKDNLKIQFVNTKYFIDQYRTIFHLHAYVTIATYFRFFITEFFQNFNRLIYLDCDLIVNCDIADLYNIDLNNHIVGCIPDIPISSLCCLNLFNEEDKKYYIETLKLSQIDNYFNAGVLVLDIRKLQDFNFTEKCIKFLKALKKPKYADQCILNHVLRNDVLLLDYKWNFQNAIAYNRYESDDYKNIVSENLTNNLISASNNPSIIHYICNKPWDDLNLINGEYFWKYARKSPYYEFILVNLINKVNVVQKKDFNLLKEIFSIRNEYKNKIKRQVITILGIKIKFKICSKPVTAERV